MTEALREALAECVEALRCLRENNAIGGGTAGDVQRIELRARAALEANGAPEPGEAETWANVVRRLLPLMGKDCDVLDDLEDFLRNRAAPQVAPEAARPVPENLHLKVRGVALMLCGCTGYLAPDIIKSATDTLLLAADALAGKAWK